MTRGCFVWMEVSGGDTLNTLNKLLHHLKWQPGIKIFLLWRELYLEFTIKKGSFYKRRSFYDRQPFIYGTTLSFLWLLTIIQLWKHFNDIIEITKCTWSRLRAVDHYAFVIGISTWALFLRHAVHSSMGWFWDLYRRWDLMDILLMP